MRETAGTTPLLGGMPGTPLERGEVDTPRAGVPLLGGPPPIWGGFRDGGSGVRAGFLRLNKTRALLDSYSPIKLGQFPDS